MLNARNIIVKYGPRVAVAGVSLDLCPGEITAIVGPNGAGKSTFLRVLNGGLVPDAGEVLLDNTPLADYSRRSIARRIAVVPQEAELRFPFSVLEFVLGGRYASASTTAWGWETEHDLDVARRVLEQTELEELPGRILRELSGGERQRALLARALATEASILLLDEPTANLDLAHQAAMLSLVRSGCREQKTAAVVITHDLNLASEFALHILLLQEGRVLAFGTPAQVLTPPLLKEAFAIDVLVDAHPVTGVPRITPVHN